MLIKANPVTCYAIALGASLGLLIIYQACVILTRLLRKLYVTKIRGFATYPLLFTRWKGTSNTTLIHLFFLIVYFATNAGVLSHQVHDIEDLSRRSALLFAVNIVPLALIGPTNIMSQYMLGLEPKHYDFAHRWMGRCAAANGLLHSCLQYRKQHEFGNHTSLSLLICATVILISSILPARRCIYELFLRLHQALVTTSIVFLWLHVKVGLTVATVGLAVFSISWNSGPGRSLVQPHTTSHDHNGEVRATQLWIRIKKPWRVQPGQYVYLTMPSFGLHSLPFLQSHPYYVAWTDNDSDSGSQSIMFLVQSSSGFSGSVSNSIGQRTILDGPYGTRLNLDQFEKVVFIASGIGICAHLLYMRSLVRAHNDNSTIVRRISVVWLLETPSQLSWIKACLDELLEEDTRNILTIVLYTPFEGQEPTLSQQKGRMFEAQRPLDLHWTLGKEWTAEMGRMAVYVCGHPVFERRVRRAIVDNGHDITLFASSFMPDETETSKLACSRLVRGASMN